MYMVQYTTANLMLTKRQKQIVDFITVYTEKHGFAPLFSDIRKRMKLRSLATVHQHISALEQKGYVERQKRRARSIVASIKEKMISIPLLGTIAAGRAANLTVMDLDPFRPIGIGAETMALGGGWVAKVRTTMGLGGRRCLVMK